jgi:hypothetical protein
MYLSAKQPNIVLILLFVLKKFHISVPVDEVIAQLKKHPENPSLLSLSDILNNYGVQNLAYSINVEDFNVLPFPFIAHIHETQSEFVLVTKIENDSITYSKGGNYENVSLSKFIEFYTGNVICIVNESTSQAKISFSKSFQSIFKSLPYSKLLIVIAISMFIYMVWSNGFLVSFTEFKYLVAVKSVGVIVSILLLIQSINSNNPLIRKICGEKVNTCNVILSSKAARIFSWLSWSDVGFFYFTGTWLVLVFTKGEASVITVLSIFNLLCLPYSFYSLYYQIKIAKQLCKLCCAVQVLFWLEFLYLQSYLFHIEIPSDNYTLENLIFWMLIPVVLWFLFRPLLLSAKKEKTLERELYDFKFDNGIFNYLLQQQPKYANPSEAWSIVLGSSEPSAIITLITGPYCTTCGLAHQQIEELLNFRDDIQVRIVFWALYVNNDPSRTIVSFLMSLDAISERSVIKEALHGWYSKEKKDLKRWLQTYNVKEDANSIDKIKQQMQWCDVVGVTGTPMVLINGRQLPKNYGLGDIKYMQFA